MSAIFIAALIVIIILVVFIVMAIRIVAGNADKRINNYFLRKLEDYDKDFKSKMDTLDQLEEQKKFLELQVKNLQKEKEALETPKYYKPRPVQAEVYIPTAHYIDSGFFTDYKIAKQMLNLDTKAIIKNVLDQVPYRGNLNTYNMALEIKAMLNGQAVYDMTTIPGADQMQILLQCLGGMQMIMLLEFIKNLADGEEFQVVEFLKWLDKQIRKESPILEAYYASEADFPDNIEEVSKNVRLLVDKNVCDGVRIIYQGRLYDYSIYESSIFDTTFYRNQY